jgi:hypothetical protein
MMFKNAVGLLGFTWSKNIGGDAVSGMEEIAC